MSYKVQHHRYDNVTQDDIYDNVTQHHRYDNIIQHHRHDYADLTTQGQVN